MNEPVTAASSTLIELRAEALGVVVIKHSFLVTPVLYPALCWLTCLMSIQEWPKLPSHQRAPLLLCADLNFNCLPGSLIAPEMCERMESLFQAAFPAAFSSVMVSCWIARHWFTHPGSEHLPHPLPYPFPPLPQTHSLAATFDKDGSGDWFNLHDKTYSYKLLNITKGLGCAEGL